MSEAARALLVDWLSRQVDGATRAWLATQISGLAGARNDAALHLAFGLIARHLGQGTLKLSEADLVAADASLAGWTPRDWSLADAGRILLVSSLQAEDRDFLRRFRSLCQTASVAEAISLYRGLPFYPQPAALEPQVGEGLRTSVPSIFQSIAHRNPYPRIFFDQGRWNQMVLKALFIGVRLAPIQGLDERTNVELAGILIDFARERWAAGRTVPFELWRCVGPFARGPGLEALERVLSTGAQIERQAAALALAVLSDASTAALLKRVPALEADIASGKLTWALLG